jgi:hypothetical protein
LNVPSTDALAHSPWAAAATAFVLVAAPPLWRFTRHVVTLVHEAGHALVAVTTGRRLSAITLHTDTSGLTVSRGKPRGLGMMATAAAGYPAPAAAGLALLWLTQAGHTRIALYGAAALLAAMAVFIRNVFGAFVVGLAASATVALTFWATPVVAEYAVSTLAWFLLLAAPRAAWGLFNHRRNATSRTSDADVLARLSVLPAGFWNAFFVAACASALIQAVRLIG